MEDQTQEQLTSMQTANTQLKSEVYDISKENQQLKGFLAHVGQVVGLTGADVTFEKIHEALTTLTSAE